jgi:hypothetical protein
MTGNMIMSCKAVGCARLARAWCARLAHAYCCSTMLLLHVAPILARGQTLLLCICLCSAAGVVLVGTIFTILLVPETRHVPIEEVEEVRIGRHWFWKRIVAGTCPPAMPMTNKDIIVGSPGALAMVMQAGADDSSGSNSPIKAPKDGAVA